MEEAELRSARITRKANLVMSSKFEKVDGGGALRPSGAAKESTEAIRAVVRHIAETALSPEGKLRPNAKFQIDIRSNEKRSDLLEDLIADVSPKGVHPDLWLEWLQGGPSPFEMKKPKSPGKGVERPSRTLLRSTPRVRAQEKKISNLREQLAVEERELMAMKALEDAALHWHVVDQLLGLLSPVFAMGPAWAIMRAIAPHLSDEHANKMTLILEDDKDARADAIKELREKWKVQSNEAMEALDFFAGNPDFEWALRGAILDVTYRFSTDQKLRAEWQEKGGRRRGKEAIRTSVNPEAKEGSEEILDSFF